MWRTILTMLLVLFSAARGIACIWSGDIEFDRELGLPPLEAILAGRYERRSDAFHDRTIAFQRSRMDIPITDPHNIVLPEMRRLAAALLARGDLDGAKSAIDRGMDFEPYSANTFALAGTIALARGEHEQAAHYLRRSLEFAPRPLFRREVYELILAEHLQRLQSGQLSRRQDPTFVRPLLRRISGAAGDGSQDDSLFTAAKARQNIELDDAIAGVAAMIRFGNPLAAELYAALGELLRFRGDDVLAERAFRRALETGKADVEFVEAHLKALRAGGGEAFSDAAVATERRSAEAWVAAFQAFEADLLKTSEAPPQAKAFGPFYEKHGNPRIVAQRNTLDVGRFMKRYWPPFALAGVIGCVAIAARIHRRRRLSAAG